MGLRLSRGNQSMDEISNGSRRKRFGAYFPRLFAYAQANMGDEAAARGVVIEAFAAVFARQPVLDEDSFRIALFGVARDLCQAAPAARPVDSCLTSRERDVVSLLFDAQLTRGEVGSLIGAPEESVTGDLVRALKKLREVLGPATIPSFLRAS